MSLVTSSPDLLPAPKPRRKGASKPRTSVSERRKIGVYVSIKAYQRLGACSLLTGRDWSKVVDELILTGLSRYVVSDRGTVDDPATVEVSAN